MNNIKESINMGTRKRVLPLLGSLLFVLVAATGLALLFPTSVALARSGSASVLPPDTCTLSAGVRTCELWAKTGSLSLPDSTTVPIWGFTDSAAGLAQVPGPALIANAGEILVVVLYNELNDDVSLTFPGQMGVLPDLVGVPFGEVAVYTMTLSQPGTHLYEAGMTANGLRQVVMGLYGALVVRPTGLLNQVYTDTATIFDDEALVVLGAVDPDFNNDPYNFALQFYHPSYRLINGKAYPDTTQIDTAAGNTIALRYVNATHETQAMGVLGLRQSVVGFDGRPVLPFGVVNETIAAGQTLDTLTSVASSVMTDTLFPLYNTALFLQNANQRLGDGSVAFGGMLTFINTVSGQLAELPGPTASNVSVNPNPTTGTLGVTLTLTLDDTLAGGGNVVAAEYFIGSLGAPGSGIPMTGPFPAPQVNVTAFISAATLGTLTSGNIPFYVRGQNNSGTWGAAGSAV
ncbi:MAG: hypothetical protein E4H27_04785, partial [Anaerolineales bacterium]